MTAYCMYKHVCVPSSPGPGGGGDLGMRLACVYRWLILKFKNSIYTKSCRYIEERGLLNFTSSSYTQWLGHTLI